MTERTARLLDILKSEEYKSARVRKNIGNTAFDQTENTELFCRYMALEEPVFIEGDRIGFYRHNADGLWNGTGNFIPNYERFLREGLDPLLEEMRGHSESEFARNSVKAIEAIYSLCDRYRAVAPTELKKALETVPRRAPEDYYEALVLVKILIFALRVSGADHVTLGRFDTYMYPFFSADIKKGMSREDALELTEEFFISINFDTDLYAGVQQGDNGQSMVLGGLDEDGRESFGELSEICMRASTELGLIDPKINLRVNKSTPMSPYILGSEMTKMGLGFPQYLNDDVIIPGLIDLGYDRADAYNYGVAACWEPIIPGGRDIPNIEVVNFPKLVNDCAHEYLRKCSSFEAFTEHLSKRISDECDRLLELANTDYLPSMRPNIVESIFSVGCTENLADFSVGAAKYNNYGFHGVGIANAADALAAIKMLIFDEKKYSSAELISALDANFEGFEPLRAALVACPKAGNNDDYVDELASFIMDTFCTHMKTLSTPWGGVCRPGTGSAMDYIRAAKNVGATADGRYAFTPYSSSFSPAITTRTNGPFSVIASFTKFDMKRIVNGGPLTLEIHDSTFRNRDGVVKVAALVKKYIDLGGHQLQLNAINRDKLLDAQKHPDKYPNLIVRVWGWSGYWRELDTEYREHIIKRTEYTV